MPDIILMRHGRPLIDLEASNAGRVAPVDLGGLIKDYEQTTLRTDEKPTKDAVDMYRGCKAKITSDLPRAIESAEMLAPKEPFLRNAIFREAGLPYLGWKWPRLSVFTLLVVFRIAWFLGFSANAESKKHALIRARIGAQELEKLAIAHGSVVLVGHGIMLRLIASELKRRGWASKNKPNNHYWAHQTLESNH